MKKIVNIVICFVILIVIGFFGLKDVFIKKMLEKELTNSLETKVRIYGVDYFVFKEKLELKGLGIESKEDDSIDAIYIKNISTNIKINELVNKKISLENLEIRDIELNKKTDRKNVKTPVRNGEYQLANKEYTSDEFKTIATNFINNYKIMISGMSADDLERNNRLKAVFLGTTIPVVDKYVDYKLSNIATDYMADIVDKYHSMKYNFKENEAQLKEDTWVVEIANLSVNTELLGRNLFGVVQGVTTDKSKMNKDILFTLGANAGDERSSITGVLNLVTFVGEIDMKFENMEVSQFLEEKDFVSGKANLVQKIILKDDEISVVGKLDVKDLILHKENISEALLGDKDGIDVIVGGTDEKINDIKVEYNYNPQFNKVFVNSNLAEKVAVYLGGDIGELDKIKKEFNEKYGEKINQAKEEIKNKLEEFINIFSK